MTATHTLTEPTGTWRVSLHQPNDRPDGDAHGSEAICMIDDRQTVLVRNANGRLNTPGGHPEPGETSEDTVRREVREEACAEITACRLIAFARSEGIAGPESGKTMVRDMYVARVTLLPWETPEKEIIERLVVPLDDLLGIMAADWPGLDAFSQELVDLAMAGLDSL